MQAESDERVHEQSDANAAHTHPRLSLSSRRRALASVMQWHVATGLHRAVSQSGWRTRADSHRRVLFQCSSGGESGAAQPGQLHFHPLLSTRPLFLSPSSSSAPAMGLQRPLTGPWTARRSLGGGIHCSAHRACISTTGAHAMRWTTNGWREERIDSTMPLDDSPLRSHTPNRILALSLFF